MPKISKQYFSPASNETISKNKSSPGEFSHIDDSEGLWGYVAKQSLLADKEDRLQQVVAGGLIHSTMFPELCPRRVALHRRTKVPVRPQKLSYNDKIVWAIGRALEELNRNALIEEVGREAIIGEWRCKCKHNPVKIVHNYDTTKRGEYVRCEHCGHYPDDYYELPIFLDEYNAVCNPDLSYFNKYNQVVSWELKSIKGNTTSQLVGFPDLDKPQVGNKQQALMQNLFMDKSEGVDPADYIRVHYTSKQHTGYKLAPWKEFKENVSDNKALYKSNEELLEKGKVIKYMTLDGRVAGEYDAGYGLPEKVEGKKQCKECQIKAICMSL